jgi:hypothetical protein
MFAFGAWILQLSHTTLVTGVIASPARPFFSSRLNISYSYFQIPTQKIFWNRVVSNSHVQKIIPQEQAWAGESSQAARNTRNWEPCRRCFLPKQQAPIEQIFLIKVPSALEDRFKYESLEEKLGTFRLVTIQPATSSTATIECTITHDQIAGASYKALSYTWGDPNQKGAITLNGFPFEVSSNLFIVLEHLRDQTEPLTLWIDAICP